MPVADFLHAIFARESTGRTFDPLVSVGGQNLSGSYVGLSFDASGNLLISGNITTTPSTGTTTTIARIFDSSGNSIIATNTNPVGTEQGLITRIAAAQALQGATAPNSPVLHGSEGRTTDGTAVASGQLVRILSDTLGKQVVLQGAVNDLHLDGQVNIAQVAAAVLIANQGAGRKIVLQNLLATCSGSQTVQVIITGGPSSRTFGYAFPGGGFQVAAGGAPLYITSASSALSVQGDVTSTMNIFASGYSIGN